jgi:hypothetical protein
MAANSSNLLLGSIIAMPCAALADPRLGAAMAGASTTDYAGYGRNWEHDRYPRRPLRPQGNGTFSAALQAA